MRAGGIAVASQAANDVFYATDDETMARLAAGTVGQTLSTNGTGSAPSWASPLTEQTTNVTGSNDNFAVNGAAIYLRCTGAAAVFTGFTIAGSAPIAGARLVLECIGTTLKVVHQATSTAANQIICESAQGQIVGANGRIELIYDGTTTRWRATVVDPGAPIAVTFDAANFTASSGNWTLVSGDQTTFTYQQRGKLLTLAYQFVTTTVSATPAALQLSLLGFTSTRQSWGVGTGNPDTGGQPYESTPILCAASGTVAQIRRQNVDGASWSTVTDLCNVYGTFTIEVN